MAYTQTTLAQFTSDIASALSDPSNVYWSAAEIQSAIKESLLLWGALTSQWVDRGTFAPTARQPFYDLSTQLPTLRRRTYTYDQLATEIQYHLLETANGSAGTGMTAQFSIANLLASLLRQRNQLMLDLRVPLTFGTQSLTTPPSSSGIVTLSDSVALISRLAWAGLDSRINRVRLIDPYQANASKLAWPQSPGKPIAYSQAETTPTEVQLIPPPLDIGTLHLIYAQSQSSTASTLSLPDELVHGVKWGALYTLLSSNDEGMDADRAEYCQKRYDQYSRLAPLRSVFSVRVNNRPVPLFTLDDMDAALPDWQWTYGSPIQCATAYDILALYKVPTHTSYAISCDVVQSAPLPAAAGDYLQVGREDLAYLFDYCRHVLTFKLGGSEFFSTLPLYDNFLSGAARRNQLISQLVQYLTPLFDQTAKQQAQTPST